jgi:hypothetical protein
MIRRSSILLVSVLALATATAALGAAGALRTVHRGQLVRLSVATPSTGNCQAVITYLGGTVQGTATASPAAGRVTWSLRIPRRAPLGVAAWYVRCGVLWQKTGSWRVARA